MTDQPPPARPRLVVAVDGSQVAVAEGGGISLFELPHRKRMAEINIDPDAEGFDVGWVGSPARLVVVSRFGEHTTVHLLDPTGPRTIAEIQLETPVRLYATVGTYALVAGSAGIAVLNATENHLTPYQFPARALPTAACASSSRFMVAVPGAIEEWDPHSRMPKRRLRLPRPATITSLGASDRVVWMTTQQDPTRIDVVPLVNRGQPKAHDLAEPIAFATGHPKSEIVICLGAETHKLYAVDLDGRMRHRTIAADGIDRVDAAGLVAGKTLSVAIVQSGRPLTITSLDQRDAEAAAPTSTSVTLPWSDASRSSALVEDSDRTPEPELPTDSLESISTRANIAAPWGARGTTDPGLGISPLGFVGSTSEDASTDAPTTSAWSSSPAPARATAMTDAAASAPTAAARAFPSSRASRPNIATATSSSAPSSAPSSAGPGAPSSPPAALKAAKDLSRRFSAWRERLKDSSSSSAAPAASTTHALSSEAAAATSPATSATTPSATLPSTSHSSTPASSATPSSTWATPVSSATPPSTPAIPSTPSSSATPSATLPSTPPSTPPSTLATSPSTPALSSTTSRASRAATLEPWREELVAWMRARTDNASGPAMPHVTSIDELTRRFDLSSAMIAPIALLYGAHLAGIHGVAPIDIARLCGGQWDEALGRGELAEAGLVVHERSRVVLAAAVLRVLDDLPPTAGVVVGQDEPDMGQRSALLGPCGIVAGEPLDAIAMRLVPRLGPILAGFVRCDMDELYLEAKARGCVPMLRVEDAPRLRMEPAVYVAAMPTILERLGLPHL